MAPIRMPEEGNQRLFGGRQFRTVNIRRYLTRRFITPLSDNIGLQHPPGAEDDQMLLMQFCSGPQKQAPRSFMNITRQNHSGFNIFYGNFSHIPPSGPDKNPARQRRLSGGKLSRQIIHLPA